MPAVAVPWRRAEPDIEHHGSVWQRDEGSSRVSGSLQRGGHSWKGAQKNFYAEKTRFPFPFKLNGI